MKLGVELSPIDLVKEKRVTTPQAQFGVGNYACGARIFAAMRSI